MLTGLVDVIVLTSAQVRDGREKLLCSDVPLTSPVRLLGYMCDSRGDCEHSI